LVFEIHKLMQFPITDTHCDLLSYLVHVPNANPEKTEDIACAFPLLKRGGVKFQVCAIYTTVEPNSMLWAEKQALKYHEILQAYKNKGIVQADGDFMRSIQQQDKIGLVAAIENAAGLAHETAPISVAFTQLDKLIQTTSRFGYISLTHHTENRFGGGNYSTGVGLKEDGKKILDYISGKKIPIDLSHTSDLLAAGILTHIDRNGLDIPVIASHSNFRSIWDHPRNLTDEFVQEIIRRKGIIGVNFLRAFLDVDHPERIFDHILYAFGQGAENQICFGADFFYTRDFPDKSRFPFYFPIVEDATQYPALLERLKEKLSTTQLENLAYRNCSSFYGKLWD
jgi:membrane dipeptidase